MAEFSPFSRDRDTGFVGQTSRPDPFPGGPSAGAAPTHKSTQFNPLFDPSRRDAFGLIGRMMGNPSQRQINFESEARAAQTAQAARAPAFEALRESIEGAGGDVPRGVMNFLNTPEGARAFTDDPDFAKNLAPILQAVKEQPSTASAREEGRARGMTAGEVLDERSQTEEVKTTRQLAEIMDMSVQDLAKIQHRTEHLTKEVREALDLAIAAGLGPEKTQKFMQDLLELKIDGPITEATRTLIAVSEATGTPLATLMLEDRALKAAAVNGPKTQLERSLLEAENLGLISHEQSVLVSSGVLRIRPRRDADGTETGEFDLINLADNTVTQLRPLSAAEIETISPLRDPEALRTMADGTTPIHEDDAAKEILPAEAIDPVALAEVPPEAIADAEGFPSAHIVDGAGFAGVAKEIFGDLAGNLSPRFADVLTISRRNQLRNINLAAQGLANSGKLKGMFELVNRVSSALGAATNPAGTAQLLLDLHGMLEQREAVVAEELEPRETRDTDISKEARRKAEAERVALSKLRKSLPTKPALEAKLADLLAQNKNPISEALGEATQNLQDEGLNVPSLGNTGGGGSPLTNPDAGASNPNTFRTITGDEDAARLGEQKLRADSKQSKALSFLDVFQEALDASNAGDAFVGNELSKAANATFPGTSTSIASVTEALSETMRPIMTSSTRLAMGFNIRLAEMLGAPVDAVNEALVALGQDGFLESTGDATSALKQQFVDMGFTGTGVIDTLEGEIGSAGLDAALHAAVLLAAAPSIAATEGTNIATVIAREVATLSTKYPGLTLAQFTGAAAGAPAFTAFARKIAGGDLSPTTEAFTDLAGGIIGGGTFSVLASTGRAGRAVTEAAARGPLSNIVKDLTPIRMAAQRVLEKERAAVNNTIKGIIDDFSKAIPGKEFDPISKARTTIKELQALKLSSDNVMDDLWAAVNTRAISVKDHMDPMVTLLKKLRADAPLGSAKETLPGAIMAKLLKLAKAKKLSAFDLQAVRGDIRALYKDPTVRASATKAANKIDSEIIAILQRAAPDKPALQIASEYSVFHNAKFRSGVVGDIVRGGQKVREENSLQLVQRLVQSEGGGEVISQTALRLENSKALKAAEAGIREEFGKIAADADANAAARAAESGGLKGDNAAAFGSRAGARAGGKFLRNPQVQRFMKAFPKAQVEADTAINDLSRATAASNKLDQSAWAKFSDKTPEEAVSLLFTMKNSAAAGRAIRLGVASDPAAIRALDSGVFQHFFRGKLLNEATPSLVLKQFRNEDTAKTLTGVLGGEKYRRMVKLLEAAAVDEGKGGGTVLFRAISSLGGTAAKLGGALFGRALGTGTIQVPQIMSTKASGMFDRLMSNFMDPANLLSRAIGNPQFERLLLSRNPTNLKEAAALTNKFRATIATEFGFSRLKKSSQGSTLPPRGHP